MAGAMAEMALLHTPLSPSLPLSPPRTRSSSRDCSPANFLNIFDAFTASRNVVWRPKRSAAGGVRLGLRLCHTRASVGEDNGKEPQPFLPPGEMQYFGKLSASCVAGALLVKYGSLCVPSVTSPDLNLALTIIVTPCVVSVVLLALASILGAFGNTRKQ